MKFNLKSGVNLHFMKNNQFKTTQIVVSFINKLKHKEDLVYRSLLSNILENSNLYFHNQNEIMMKLSNLYGANLEVDSEVIGNFNIIKFKYSFINIFYLKQNKLSFFNELMDFLNNMIFNPYIFHNLFDLKVFNQHKKNFYNYLNSIYDDSEFKSLMATQILYFNNDIQKYAPYGLIEDIIKISNNNLVKYYYDMLNNDIVKIDILGNLEKQFIIDNIVNNSNIFVFRSRDNNISNEEIFYKQPISNPKFESEREDLNQSRLNLIYQLNNNVFSRLDYYSTIVMNALLGGSFQSILFQIVREKEGLAYDISSSYSRFRSTIFIQTGIQAKNKDKVLFLIHQQINNLRTGHFSQESLNIIKKEIISDYNKQQDIPEFILDQNLINDLLNEKINYNEKIIGIASITKNDIIRISNKMIFQAEYFLKGE